MNGGNQHAGREPAISQRPLRELYRENLGDLVRLAWLITGSNNAAEDIVHDAFLSMQGRLARIRNPEAYLRQSVINGSRSHLRHLRVHRNAPLPRPQPVLPQEVDETWTLVQRLPAKQRTALVLRYYIDLPVNDIATLMKARPGTVKSLLHRGRDTLRKQLT